MGAINYFKLLPFVIFFIAYFIIYKPHLKSPPETLGSAWFKVLPILSLVVYVLPQGKPLSSLTALQRNTAIGLLVSGIGDIFMVWRTLFIPGVLAFGVAHVFYLNAFWLSYTPPPGYSQRKSKSLLLFIVTFLGSSVLWFKNIPTTSVMCLCVGYNILLHAIAWRATVKYEYERTIKNLAGCVGTIFFLVSDLLIGVNMFVFPIPGAAGLIMLTYYAAQLGISISAS